MLTVAFILSFWPTPVRAGSFPTESDSLPGCSPLSSRPDEHWYPDLPYIFPKRALPLEESLRQRLRRSVRVLGSVTETAHDRLERGILQETIRLDSFFGNEETKKGETSYSIYVRNALRWQQGGKFGPEAAIRADVDLSRINDRLNLLISGENETTPFAPRLPEDPGNPGMDRTFQPARVVNTELRYQLIRNPSTYLFVGAGLELALPPHPFVRTRIQYTHPWSELLKGRVAETVFAKTNGGPGETTEFSLERILTKKAVLLWSTSGTVSEQVRALEWGSELSFAYALSAKSSLILTGGVYGDTSKNDWITNYQTYLRYRRNFLRKWLFYELEPQVSWPRQGDGAFPTTYAFTVRLEVQFRGKEPAEP